MKKLRSILPIILIFAVGLSLLLYPFVANQWNTYRQSQLMTDYKASVKQAEDAGLIDYEAELARANQFNQDLLPSILPDSFAIAEAKGEMGKDYYDCLNLLGDGMMGTIEIPKIKVNIPIFHGTSEDVLQRAAGHLEGSSLPVGGENTHAVISAHRGLPSATLFTDLDKLEAGDYFVVHVLDLDLYYEVDQSLVVEPDQTDALAVESGKDLVTLVTCTPYGVNTHRMLVRGHRCDPVDLGETPSSVLDTVTGTSLHTNYLLWVIVGFAVVIVAYIVMSRIDRSRRRKRAAAKAEAVDVAAAEAEIPAEVKDDET